MNYSDDLDFVVNHALEDLIEFYKEGNIMFNANENYMYHEIYDNLKKDEINSNF